MIHTRACTIFHVLPYYTHAVTQVMCVFIFSSSTSAVTISTTQDDRSLFTPSLVYGFPYVVSTGYTTAILTYCPLTQHRRHCTDIADTHVTGSEVQKAPTVMELEVY